MTLELGNFKYDGDRFYIAGKLIRLSRMRYKILKLLVEHYKMKPVSSNQIIHELYYDCEYRKDEPDSQSFKVIIHSIRKMLNHLTGNKVTITANKGSGYTLDYNAAPVVPYQRKLTKEIKEAVLKMHASGTSSIAIASKFGISKHKVYDIVIRNKQDKLLKSAFGDDYAKKRI